MSEVIFLVKILLAVIELAIGINMIVREKRNKPNKTIFLGIVLIFAIITTNCHWSSILCALALSVAYSLFNKALSEKIKKPVLVIAWNYVLPVVIYIFSYLIPIFVMYGNTAVVVALPIAKVVIELLIISVLLYVVLQLKYLFIYLFLRKGRKLNTIIEECPLSIIPMVLVIYIPLIFM